MSANNPTSEVQFEQDQNFEEKLPMDKTGHEIKKALYIDDSNGEPPHNLHAYKVFGLLWSYYRRVYLYHEDPEKQELGPGNKTIDDLIKQVKHLGVLVKRIGEKDAAAAAQNE